MWKLDLNAIFSPFCRRVQEFPLALSLADIVLTLHTHCELEAESESANMEHDHDWCTGEDHVTKKCSKCCRCSKCGLKVEIIPFNDQPGAPELEKAMQPQSLPRKSLVKVCLSCDSPFSTTKP
jgi:hypothetical protein